MFRYVFLKPLHVIGVRKSFGLMNIFDLELLVLDYL